MECSTQNSIREFTIVDCQWLANPAIGSRDRALCAKVLFIKFSVAWRTAHGTIDGMKHPTILADISQNAAEAAQRFASPKRMDQSIEVIEVDESYSGCSWHFHPELQLCHVESGFGQRLIGDRVCEIQPGEVILLGANLPHVWRYDSTADDDIQATVVHFDESVLGSDWLQRPELRDVRLLLTRAGQGLQARGDVREHLIEKIGALTNAHGLRRIIVLLEILQVMAESRDLETVCSSGYQPVAAELDVERLRRACDYIKEHAHESLDRETVARVIHMSATGFSRFFKAHTGMTFQEFVSDVRISRACQLLANTDLLITDIALQCGFGELSTFNRTFKRFRDTTPTKYRALVSSIRS